MESQHDAPHAEGVETTVRRWQDLDAAHYLHPFTDHKALRKSGVRVLERAEGAYTFDVDGARVLDGLSGIGCVNLGYGRTELADAAAAAMRKLSYAQSFFNTTNQPAIELAEQLVELTPPNLNHVFFQSSGSEANETAVRAVLRYWELVGQPEKRMIIARENAYHGSTMLTASLSGIPPMHHAGGPLPLEGIHHIRAPYHYLHDPDAHPDVFGLAAAGWLEDKITELGAHNVAAFFAEPLQGAGGAIIPPDSYWGEIQRICSTHDVLLVVDEVVTGFGRTGAWFGVDTYKIAAPDIMVLAKGLTSGYAPLSATMIGDRVTDVLVDEGGEWFHGFTHSGHPVCCAVALKNIEILRDEQVIERAAAETMPLFAERAAALGDHDLVGDVRTQGFVAGMQLVHDKLQRTFFPEGHDVGEVCSAEALQRGVALRAIQTTMVLMPPLIVTREQIDTMFDVTEASLDAVAQQLSSNGGKP